MMAVKLGHASPSEEAIPHQRNRPPKRGALHQDRRPWSKGKIGRDPARSDGSGPDISVEGKWTIRQEKWCGAAKVKEAIRRKDDLRSRSIENEKTSKQERQEKKKD